MQGDNSKNSYWSNEVPSSVFETERWVEEWRTQTDWELSEN